jgi:polyisoprenoid-binding protein YceI
MSRTFITRIVFLAAALAAVAAPAATWRIGQGSEVVFTSKAPMESFDGRTGHVGGHVRFDPGALVGPLDLRVEVDLASLDTGIGKRNEHMRERHLQTGIYPLAVFTGRAVTKAATAALAPGQPVAVTVEGTLDLHGVARPLTVEATVTLGPDGALRVDTAFPVKLSDHAIDRPQFLVMKLADEQQVRVQLVAAPEAP